MKDSVHFNSIHETSPSECFVLAVDRLPGGKANDYAIHIHTSIDQVYFIITNIYNIIYYKLYF